MQRTNLWLLCHILLLPFLLIGCDADCIWYGQCGQNATYPDHKLNCPYDGPPKPFKTEKAEDLFAELCPDLYSGRGTNTCCSDAQVFTIAGQIAVPRQAFQRCPSCFHNFMNVWCYLTCGPQQKDFMIVNTTQYMNDTKKVAITSVDYVISDDSAVGMFNSCKNVQMPSSNERALSIVCGTDADSCTPKKWLDYMGSTGNGQAPFDIWFHISKKNISINGTQLQPLDFHPVPCNMAPSNDSQPCSCQDCTPACAPVPPAPKPTPPCEILHIDCYYFGFGLAYAVFVLVFGCYAICYNIMVQDSLRLETPGQEDSVGCCGRTGLAAARNARKQRYLDNLTRDQLGVCENWGAKMETFLETQFFKWGYMCARHPIIVSRCFPDTALQLLAKHINKSGEGVHLFKDFH